MGRKRRSWTIDDNITKDVPALVRFVRLHTGCAQVGGVCGPRAAPCAPAPFAPTRHASRRAALLALTWACGPQCHFVGHSMGGMVLTGIMARNEETAARIRSCTLLGSGCFLQGG
jgi:pimeloyl-ACP methyl ester carboxylesterase